MLLLAFSVFAGTTYTVYGNAVANDPAAAAPAAPRR